MIYADLMSELGFNNREFDGEKPPPPGTGSPQANPYFEGGVEVVKSIASVFVASKTEKAIADGTREIVKAIDEVNQSLKAISGQLTGISKQLQRLEHILKQIEKNTEFIAHGKYLAEVGLHVAHIQDKLKMGLHNKKEGQESIDALLEKLATGISLALASSKDPLVTTFVVAPSFAVWVLGQAVLAKVKPNNYIRPLKSDVYEGIWNTMCGELLEAQKRIDSIPEFYQRYPYPGSVLNFRGSSWEFVGIVDPTKIGPGIPLSEFGGYPAYTVYASDLSLVGATQISNDGRYRQGFWSFERATNYASFIEVPEVNKAAIELFGRKEEEMVSLFRLQQLLHNDLARNSFASFFEAEPE